MKTSNDMVVKSKDNRKKVVTNAVEKCKSYRSLKSATNALERAVNAETSATKEKASICFSIRHYELYKSDAETLSAYFEKVGTICGIGYKQFSSLANCFEYVWAIDELANYSSNLASALVSYCKKDAKKVVNAHKRGAINERMTKEDIREALKSDFGGKAETVKKAEKVTSKATSEIDVAFAKVYTYLKKSKADAETLKAFDVLKAEISK